MFDHLQITDWRERYLVGSTDIVLRGLAPLLIRRSPRHRVPANQICAGDGDDKVYGDFDKVSYRDGNDKVSLGKGNDYAVLGGGYNEAFGGPGNDYIRGGPGKDKIGGGPGYDKLYGQGGDDYLNGNYGYDHLYGGYGGEKYGDVCKNGEKFYNCEKKIYGI